MIKMTPEEFGEYLDKIESLQKEFDDINKKVIGLHDGSYIPNFINYMSKRQI